MASSTVHELVYKTIESSATAEGYYGNAFYTQEVPADTIPPYTVMYQISDPNEHTFLGYDNQGQATFQFDVVVEVMARDMAGYIDGINRRENLKRWVRDNLRAVTDGTMNIRHCTITDAPDRPNVDAGVAVYSFEATVYWHVA